MKNFINKIRYIFSLSTTRNIVINTTGNYLNVFFAFLFSLIIIRVLTPAEYGVLSLLFALVFIFSNILDIGISASIYSYLPLIIKQKNIRNCFIKTNFVYQTFFSTLIICFLLIFTTPINKYIIKTNTQNINYYIAFASIPLFIWQNYTLNILYASKKFLLANISLNASNIAKLVLILVFIIFNILTLKSTLFILLIIGPLVYFCIIAFAHSKKISEVLKTPFDKKQIHFGYTLTFFAATQVFNLATRVDLFLVAHFLPPEQVGFYGLSQKIVSGVLTSVNSVTQVLSPQFALIKNKSKIIPLIKKSIFFIGIPIGVFILAILTPQYIYIAAFTEKYIPAINITKFLSAAYILYCIASVFVLFFLYTIRKPIQILIINIIFLVGVTIGCITLLPVLGLSGAPISIGATLIIILAYMIIFFQKELKNYK